VVVRRGAVKLESARGCCQRGGIGETHGCPLALEVTDLDHVARDITITSLISKSPYLGYGFSCAQLLSARNGCDCAYVHVNKHVCKTRLCCDSFCVLCYRSAVPLFFRVKRIWFLGKKLKVGKLVIKGSHKESVQQQLARSTLNHHEPLKEMKGNYLTR